jgi:hypothetical protein
MKLGISYIVFHGEELLEYAIRIIRQQVDYVVAVYQDTSFTKNKARPELWSTLNSCSLIDRVVSYDQDFSLNYKENEANARNAGLDACIEAGCSHHITADVDEFYEPQGLEFVKQSIGDHDCTSVEMEVYYKRPTWRLIPAPKQIVPLIHSVNLRCDPKAEFPKRIDESRRMATKNCLHIQRSDFVVHHMSYVRRNMVEKLKNTAHRYSDHDKFVSAFRKYNLRDRVALAPDFLNRRTVLVENTFNIPEDLYDGNICDGTRTGSI